MASPSAECCDGRCDSVPEHRDLCPGDHGVDTLMGSISVEHYAIDGVKVISKLVVFTQGARGWQLMVEFRHA